MINEQTKARIAQEAEKVFPTNRPKEYNPIIMGERQLGYIAGAEAEATRSQALYDCLKLIREMPDGVWFAKTIDKALEKYDNSK